MTYTDDIQVKVYKLLKCYGCNPFYQGTHPDVTAKGENYSVVMASTRAEGKIRRYHTVEVPVVTKFEQIKTVDSDGATVYVNNMAEHIEFYQDVIAALRVETDDVIKHQLMGGPQHIQFLGKVGNTQHFSEDDTWNSSFQFRILDTGFNI